MKVKTLNFLLFFYMIFAANCFLLFAENKLDASSLFFSGDVGTDEDAIRNMMENDSGGVAVPGGIRKRAFEYKILKPQSDTISDNLKKIFNELELSFKSYCNDHPSQKINGIVKVVLDLNKSDAIVKYTIFSSTLNSKPVYAEIQKCFRKYATAGAATYKHITVQISYN